MSVFALGAISVLFYALIILVLYQFAINSRRPSFPISGYKQRSNFKQIYIVLGAALCMLYDLYITLTSVSMGGDRTNYLYDFLGYRRILTPGLQLLVDVFRLFSDNFTVFLLLVCFICIALTLYAYRIYKHATPIAIFLLLSTQYLFSTFVNLKQCFANAFAALFFAVLFEMRGRKRDIWCIVLMVLACLFHQTAIILLPIYLVCRGKNRKPINLILLLSFVALLFLDKLAVLAASILSPIVPSISAKIMEYFGSLSGAGGDAITLLKGFPYYIILAVGIRKRKKLMGKIENYDNYLLICLIMVLTQLAGLWSYWLPRLQYFLYLPVFVLFGQMLALEGSRKTRFCLRVAVCGSILFFSFRDLILIYTLYGGF